MRVARSGVLREQPGFIRPEVQGIFKKLEAERSLLSMDLEFLKACEGLRENRKGEGLGKISAVRGRESGKGIENKTRG